MLEHVAVAGGWHESVLSGVLEGSFDNISALPSKVWTHIVVVDSTRSMDPRGTVGQEFEFVHREDGVVEGKRISTVEVKELVMMIGVAP